MGHYRTICDVKHARSLRCRWRRGTATTELVLALPILFAVLGIMLFTGWSHMRKQRVIVASRYAVWRNVAGPGVSDDDLNERALNNVADSVTQRQESAPSGARKMWVDYATDKGVGDLADTLILNRWPGGRQTWLEVKFPPPMKMTRQLNDDFNFRHSRDGVTWHRGEASQWQTLTETYYQGLDDYLTGVDDQAKPLAELYRGLYRASW